ncbi:MAG: DUF1194 domain-containing protein [Ahrensia sp.]|nr:DUF1194 domain-containing protein [Ahrensia sp.]
MTRWRFIIGLLTLLVLLNGARAEDVEVDVELVLAVDVSRSMSERELEIQRRGYAEALVSEQVIRAIRGGLIGRIALRYVEWSNTGQQRTVVDWTLIDGAQAAQAVAVKLTSRFNTALRRTSISDAIDSSAASFENNGFTALRRVIDVSGDGPNNSGRPVLEARDAAIASGIIINGLPLMTSEGMGSQFQLHDLDEYYRACVVGGPGSFVIPVHDWKEFPNAVRRKLVLELASAPAVPLIRATVSGKNETGYDCLIGEKIWRQFMDRYPNFEPLP